MVVPKTVREAEANDNSVVSKSSKVVEVAVVKLMNREPKTGGCMSIEHA
jgi:hypothetical protein